MNTGNTTTPHTANIRFDGGCIPNPGQMYGSYSVSVNGDEVFRVSRIPLGRGTNNEAEFKTLIESLHKTVELINLAGMSPRSFAVSIVTDSRIVMNRVRGTMKNSARKLASLNSKYGSSGVDGANRMAALTDQCMKPLGLFGAHTIKWEPRDSNVESFGH